MPKLSCLCGETINLSPIPNDASFLLFGEPQYEDLIDAATQRMAEPASDPKRDYRIYDCLGARRPKPELVECPDCGRLALFLDMSDSVPIWYAPVTPLKEGSLKRLFFPNGGESNAKIQKTTPKTSG